MHFIEHLTVKKLTLQLTACNFFVKLQYVYLQMTHFTVNLAVKLRIFTLHLTVK